LLAAAEVPAVVHPVPRERERVANAEVHRRRVLGIVEADGAPAARAARVAAAADPAEHAGKGVAADHEGGGRPVDLVADVVEAVVGVIADLPLLVHDEAVGDERRGGLDVLLRRDGAAAGEVGRGRPGVELQEGVEIVPSAAVGDLGGGVPRAAPAAVAPLVARLLPQRGFHRVESAAEPPAVDVDELECRHAARLGGVGVVVARVAAEMVDRDGALVVGLAVAGHRLHDRLERRAVRRAVVDDLDVAASPCLRDGASQQHQQPMPHGHLLS